MQALSMDQVRLISGGMSEKMVTSAEGGLFGITEGAILCGVVVGLPLWALATSGVTASSQTLGVVLFFSSVTVGGVLGGILGTCTGYVVACTS